MNPLVIFVAALGAILLVSHPAHASVVSKKPADHVAAQSLAHKWSHVFDVPVSWIRSQTYAESRDAPDAENERTGALGLLQVLPSTAAWLVVSLVKSKFSKNKRVAKTLGEKWKGKREDLLDPDLNVMLATYYMLLLRNKFGNDHNLVAAAYNAGPNKIARLLAAGQPLPKESRTYLAMVADAKSRGYM